MDLCGVEKAARVGQEKAADVQERYRGAYPAGNKSLLGHDT